jgi:hypothetical protein
MLRSLWTYRTPLQSLIVFMKLTVVLLFNEDLLNKRFVEYELAVS